MLIDLGDMNLYFDTSKFEMVFVGDKYLKSNVFSIKGVGQYKQDDALRNLVLVWGSQDEAPYRGYKEFGKRELIDCRIHDDMACFCLKSGSSYKYYMLQRGELCPRYLCSGLQPMDFAVKSRRFKYEVRKMYA